MTRKSCCVFPLILLYLSSYSLGAHAATINAASCSQSAVQNAVNSASDGDTVTVPAGSCTWASTVTIQNKGITLQGAGIDQTTIVDNIASNHTLNIFVSSAYSVSRVTGFTFDANSVGKSGELAEISVTAQNSGLDRFRLDNFKVKNLVSRGVLVWMKGYDLGGVIDSCEIDAPSNVTAQGIAMEGTGPEDGTPFTRPLTLGSNHAIYMEDCTFNYSFPNDGAYDAYTGARYVFRHNTVNGTIIGHHGADSGTGRGIASFEIYNNTFNSSGVGVSRVMFFRSGTGVVFNNVASTAGGGNYSDGIVIANYRSCGSYQYWGQCDGTSPWDGNQPSQQGYACLDQVGHVFTANQGGSNQLVPLYSWNNTLNGSTLNTTKDKLANSCTTFQNVHMIENRDFYNGSPAAGYSPYTYPHPLRSVGSGSPAPPAPPTGLKATVQ